MTITSESLCNDTNRRYSVVVGHTVRQTSGQPEILTPRLEKWFSEQISKVDRNREEILTHPQLFACVEAVPLLTSANPECSPEEYSQSARDL